MATIGLTFFIEGLAQLLWGAQRARPRARHRRTCRSSGCRQTWNINVSASSTSSPRGVAGGAGRGARALLPEARASAARCARWPTITRRRSRSAFRCSTSGRSSGRWPGFVALVAGAPVGRAQRRAVRADLRRAEGAAGADPRRLRLDPGRDRRRPDHRRHARSSPRSTSGRIVGGGIEGWFAYVLALLFLLVRPEGLFGEKHIDRV